ncbi:unnamed protein product [Mytilus coruscus]|uniref:Ig-like domain-containing protein n=1 Tax=Mytilus coruscus TaxID=42192 RepID=A0A6J8CB06_MYTCO|nr:unnamed protein product [Mytilus coruscus]
MDQIIFVPETNGLNEYKSGRIAILGTFIFWSQMEIQNGCNDTTVTANIDENVTLSWTTGLTNKNYVEIKSPKSKLIFSKQYEGEIISNTKGEKYKFDEHSTDLNTINITVIHLDKADAGLYHAYDVDKETVDGCCLLVATTQPMKPTLTIDPEHPFVNDSVTLTCLSTVQRWPSYIPSNLSYQYFGYRRSDTKNDKLIIQTLTRLDKGINISCQATDDRRKGSIMSDTVILDPYYGPDNVVLTPEHTAINVTEGTTLGPIRCTATCNPKCLFKWKLYKTGTFENVLPGETLVVANITKNQTGIYRCRAVHPNDKSLHRRTDISVNVQYSPKITLFCISDNRCNATAYSYNEGMNPKITLRIESNPDPQLELNSSLLIVSPLSSTKQTNEFSTQLPSLKCEDSGNFTIHARNGIAYGDNRTVKLVICCKPRDVKTERKIGTKANTDINIVMNVISFPAPNVTWLRMTTFIWTVRIDKYDYRYNISSTVQITSEDDFGEHGIKICNSLGCIVENITLQPEDKPEAPLNFTVGTTTFRSVNLSWIVGFNGGHEQTFTVHFKTRDGDEVKKTVQTSETKTGSTSIEDYTSVDDNLTTSAEMTDTDIIEDIISSSSATDDQSDQEDEPVPPPRPSMNSVFAALNTLNAHLETVQNSNSTMSHWNFVNSFVMKHHIHMEPFVKSPSKSASMTPIFIGIGCGIAVILIIVTSLYVFCSRRNRGSTSESTKSNVLYAAVDKEQQKTKRRNPENEDSNLSNEPANAEYASVVKPKSKSKKVHYKEDEIESANNEYAVVDTSNKKIDYAENDNVYPNQGNPDLVIHQPLKTKPSGRSKNQDGLTYIEVSFTRKPKDRRRIIGAENRTEYVDIDFTRKADPLPESSDQ